MSYTAAQRLVQVLEQCGDDLTRDNVLRQQRKRRVGYNDIEGGEATGAGGGEHWCAKGVTPLDSKVDTSPLLFRCPYRKPKVADVTVRIG